MALTENKGGNLAFTFEKKNQPEYTRGNWQVFFFFNGARLLFSLIFFFKKTTPEEKDWKGLLLS